MNQEVARELLADAGCTVDVVSNGLQAVQAVEEHLRAPRYDLVLMDCQMPELDGFEATRRIREMERARGQESAASPARLPIIALTANAIEGDRQRCIAVGMDDYVTKPVDPDVLIETVRALMAKRPAVIAGKSEASIDARVATPPDRVGQARLRRPHVPAELPIDSKSLLRRCGGKPHLAERLLSQFGQQLETQMVALRESLDQRDGQLMTRLAHTVKGAAANMSAVPVQDAAGELEKKAAAAEFAAAATALEQLTDRVHQCIEYAPTAVVQLRQIQPESKPDSSRKQSASLRRGHEANS